MGGSGHLECVAVASGCVDGALARLWAVEDFFRPHSHPPPPSVLCEPAALFPVFIHFLELTVEEVLFEESVRLPPS